MTLNNSIAPLAVSHALYRSYELQKRGESIATGYNKSVDVIENFIGSAENDTCQIAKSTLKSTITATNLLEIGESRIIEASAALQKGLGAIGKSAANPGHFSILQTQLDADKVQVDTLLKSANFDNMGLFSGEAKNIQIPVGTSITDTVKISLPDLLNGKLYRTSITTELNKWIVADPARSNYYANAGEIADDDKNNVNLVACSLAHTGGSGTGATMPDNQLAAALFALSPKSKRLLNLMAPTAKQYLITNEGGSTFVNASQAQLQAMLTNNVESTRIDQQITDMLGVVVNQRASIQEIADRTRDVIELVPGLPESAKEEAREAACHHGGIGQRIVEQQAALCHGNNAARHARYVRYVRDSVRSAAYDALR